MAVIELDTPITNLMKMSDVRRKHLNPALTKLEKVGTLPQFNYIAPETIIGGYNSQLLDGDWTTQGVSKETQDPVLTNDPVLGRRVLFLKDASNAATGVYQAYPTNIWDSISRYGGSFEMTVRVPKEMGTGQQQFWTGCPANGHIGFPDLPANGIIHVILGFKYDANTNKVLLNLTSQTPEQIGTGQWTSTIIPVASPDEYFTVSLNIIPGKREFDVLVNGDFVGQGTIGRNRSDTRGNNSFGFTTASGNSLGNDIYVDRWAYSAYKTSSTIEVTKDMLSQDSNLGIPLGKNDWTILLPNEDVDSGARLTIYSLNTGKVTVKPKTEDKTSLVNFGREHTWENAPTEIRKTELTQYGVDSTTGLPSSTGRNYFVRTEARSGDFLHKEVPEYGEVAIWHTGAHTAATTVTADLEEFHPIPVTRFTPATGKLKGHHELVDRTAPTIRLRYTGKQSVACKVIFSGTIISATGLLLGSKVRYRILNASTAEVPSGSTKGNSFFNTFNSRHELPFRTTGILEVSPGDIIELQVSSDTEGTLIFDEVLAEVICLTTY